MHVTVSLCHGAPARVAAIQYGLEEFRPDYLHMWQLKTFWSGAVIDLNDVEYQSFAKVGRMCVLCFVVY